MEEARQRGSEVARGQGHKVSGNERSRRLGAQGKRYHATTQRGVRKLWPALIY